MRQEDQDRLAAQVRTPREEVARSVLEGLGAAAGWLLLLTPIANPDLPWHLSAGRRIVETRAVPAADWLSWTRAGSPWTDFEWGTQLLWHSVWSLGGIPGLFALKAAGFALLFFLFHLILKRLDIPAPWRGAAAAGLGAALSLVSDLRPDLSSLVFFTAELLFVEAGRGGLAVKEGRRFWLPAHAVGYALWANLHPGFVMGLALLGLYAAGAFVEERLDGQSRPWRELGLCAAAGLLGTVGTPNGFGLFQLVAHVQRDMKLYDPLIFEWRAADPRLLLHRPFWLLLVLLPATWVHERRLRWPHLFAALVLGSMAVSHNRHIPFFAIFALPAAALALKGGPALPAWLKRGAAAAGLLLLAAFARVRVSDGLGSGVWDTRFYPEGVCGYLLDQVEELDGLKMFHPMSWGGYLGWRLNPDYKVYWDGRFIFVDLLKGAIDATQSAPAWSRFLKEQDIELVALERGRLGKIPFRTLSPPTRGLQGVPSPRRGESLVVPRPAERLYMRSSDWALVYWDSQADLFVRRDKVEPEWLEEHEFRLLFPDDQEWLRSEAKAGRLPSQAVAEEVRRYLESDADEPEKARWDTFLSGL